MNDKRRMNNADGVANPVRQGMKQSGYLLVPVALAMVVSLYFFLPAQKINIDEVNLEQLELDIKIGLEKNLRVFSRAKHSVSVQECTIQIISNFTKICVSRSEHTRKVTKIHLPEIGKFTLYASKVFGNKSYMFDFSGEIVDVIKKSRQIYLENKPRRIKTYRRGHVTTPTDYKFDFPSQQSQKYLKNNNVISSEILYTCRGYLSSQLFFGGIILHLKPGDPNGMSILFGQIDKYRKSCTTQVNSN